MVYEDNAATISIAARPYLTSRTRHIHLRDLYVRELVTNGDVEIRYVKTNENIVGFFANPSRLPRSASTAISSWASARSSARELRLHASCAATSTSRRQVAQSRQLALSGNAGVQAQPPLYGRLRQSTLPHCLASYPRPARRPSPWRWQDSATQERNSPWSSGPVAPLWRHMFLCFCQLRNSWRSHTPFRTTSTIHSSSRLTELSSSAAPGVPACPPPPT